MIDPSEYNYYLVYAFILVCLLVAYVKVKSTDGATITTKEFKSFQYNFLGSYGMVIAAELIAVASFFHIMTSLKLNMEQITTIYITTIISTATWEVLIEIFDIGSRRTKCALSAALYATSFFGLYFGGHYEMVLLSRVIFGAASSLHHSSFETYVIHQHTILGFPDDWLSQTFSMLPHVMAIAAASSGPIGQIFAGTATGSITIIIVISAIASAYIQLVWEKDTNPPRFMWSNFMYTMNNTISSVMGSKEMRNILFVGALYEASVLVFSFYWAPWLLYHSIPLDIVTDTADIAEVQFGGGNADGNASPDTRLLGGFSSLSERSDTTTVSVDPIPYEIIFSCYICASMLGNYMYTIYSNQMYELLEDEAGLDVNMQIFHWVLLGTVFAYLAAATVSSPLLIFIISIVIHLCMGAYWSCIGTVRAQFKPEYRTAPVTITRFLSLVFAVLILTHVHHSPTMVLLSCGSIVAAAAYCQFNLMNEERNESTDDLAYDLPH